MHSLNSRAFYLFVVMRVPATVMDSQLAADLEHFSALIATLPAPAQDATIELKHEAQTSSRSELKAKLEAKLEATKQSRNKRPK